MAQKFKLTIVLDFVTKDSFAKRLQGLAPSPPRVNVVSERPLSAVLDPRASISGVQSTACWVERKPT